MYRQIEGDLNHTSTQVRLTAIKAIEEAGRPITAHELEEYLAANEPEIWKDVSEKCYDYVRMILSVTKNNVIIKYKCRHSIPNVDPRAAFYGLSNKYYPEDEWIRISDLRSKKANNKKASSITPPPMTVPSPVLTPNYTVPNLEYVNEEEASQSWKKLSSEINMNDPLWVDLLQALNDVKIYIDQGSDPKDILQYIFKTYGSLQNTHVAQAAFQILCREAIINQQRQINQTVLY